MSARSLTEVDMVQNTGKRETKAAIANKKYETKFAEESLIPETFLPNAGDVLIWHPNLAHRGSRAVDPSRPRLAAIGHFSGIQVRADMPAAVQHGDGGWYFPIG